MKAESPLFGALGSFLTFFFLSGFSSLVFLAGFSALAGLSALAFFDTLAGFSALGLGAALFFLGFSCSTYRDFQSTVGLTCVCLGQLRGGGGGTIIFHSCCFSVPKAAIYMGWVLWHHTFKGRLICSH
jgi:hypothetical protein